MKFLSRNMKCIRNYSSYINVPSSSSFTILPRTKPLSYLCHFKYLSLSLSISVIFCSSNFFKNENFHNRNTQKMTCIRRVPHFPSISVIQKNWSINFSDYSLSFFSSHLSFTILQSLIIFCHFPSISVIQKN